MKSIREFMLRPWIYLIIALIGVTLKFYKVDYHYFWFDEMAAIEHTSGLTGSQTYELIPKNKILPISFYKNLIHLNSRNLSIKSQLKGLSRMTNLNPLHYGVLVFWYRLVGDKDVHYRYVNVFFFLISLPFLFFLTKNLFKSNLSGWIAISLLAVSPFFHYYAHEARYNALLAFLIILNNFLFVKALNQSRRKWWIGYTISGILLLYTSLLSGLLFIGHIAYILVFKRNLWKVYGLSSMLIFLGYLPWLISIINKFSEINTALEWHSFYSTKQNFLTLILAQISMMAHTFATLKDGWLWPQLIDRNFEGYQVELIITIFIATLLIYSIIYASRKLPKKVSYFMILLVIPQFLFFLFSDLIRGTGISLIHRYQMIGIIGILLFFVFLHSEKISLGKLSYLAVYTGIVVLGLTSIISMSKNRCWDLWSGMCGDNIEDARIFSSAEKPLLITGCYLPVGTGIGGFMAIMNECSSDSIDIMQVLPDVRDIKEKLPRNYYSDIYLVYAHESLVKNLKSQLSGQMDSLEIKRVSPIWKINLE